jgi:membrane-associated phospholipid phosphatase
MFLFGYKKSAFTILPFFIIMLLSRIIAWVHWPLDIIVWSIVWIFSSFIIFKNTDFYIFKNINKVFLKIASFIKL